MVCGQICTHWQQCNFCEWLWFQIPLPEQHYYSRGLGIQTSGKTDSHTRPVGKWMRSLQCDLSKPRNPKFKATRGYIWWTVVEFTLAGLAEESRDRDWDSLWFTNMEVAVMWRKENIAHSHWPSYCTLKMASAMEANFVRALKKPAQVRDKEVGYNFLLLQIEDDNHENANVLTLINCWVFLRYILDYPKWLFSSRTFKMWKRKAYSVHKTSDLVTRFGNGEWHLRECVECDTNYCKIYAMRVVKKAGFN